MLKCFQTRMQTSKHKQTSKLPDKIIVRNTFDWKVGIKTRKPLKKPQVIKKYCSVSEVLVFTTIFLAFNIYSGFQRCNQIITLFSLLFD